MKRWLVAVLCAGVSGCATSGQKGNITPVSTVDIVEKLRCELYQEITEKKVGGDESTWTVNAALTMKMEQKGGLHPSLTFIDVVNPQKTVSWFLPFSLENGRSKQYDQTFDIVTKDLKGDGCLPEGREAIRGQFGLAKFFDEYRRTVEVYGDRSVPGVMVSKNKEEADFKAEIEFSLTAGLTGAGVTWALDTFSGPGGALKASNTSTNTLALVMNFLPERKVARTVVMADGKIQTRVETVAPSVLEEQRALDSGRQELQQYLLQNSE